jgi:hypothetical protein
MLSGACSLSNPIATSNGSVGVRSVNATSTGSTFKHLTARAGNGSRLGTRLSSSSSSARGTSLLFVLRVGLNGGLGNGLSVLLVLVDGPVEDVVILEPLADEKIAEDLAEVAIVGLVVEAERASVVEVDGELVRESAAENLGRSGHLLLHDAVVLLLLGGSLETLPRKRTTAEVEHDVTKRLHVITTGLLNTQVGVDGSITSSSGKVLVLSVRDVEVSLGVSVLLSKTEIDHVHLVSTLANAHEEVVGLDITVDERLGMDVLDSGDELIGKKQDRLEGEFPVAEVEKILQTGTEEIQDHGVVVTFRAEPSDEGDTDTAGEGLVDTGLILELRVLGLDRLELDSNFLTRDDIGSEVDIAKRAGSDLTADTVLVTDAKIHGSHLDLSV